MTALLTHTKTFEGKRMSGVLDEFELQLQVALLCCHALESKDFTSVLSSAANLHNLSVEYARCKPAGSGERVKYTVFFTSDVARAVGVGSTASSASILQPTAYVVFTQPHPPKDSWLSDFACSCVQTHGGCRTGASSITVYTSCMAQTYSTRQPQLYNPRALRCYVLLYACCLRGTADKTAIACQGTWQALPRCRVWQTTAAARAHWSLVAWTGIVCSSYALLLRWCTSSCACPLQTAICK